MPKAILFSIGTIILAELILHFCTLQCGSIKHVHPIGNDGVARLLYPEKSNFTPVSFSDSSHNFAAADSEVSRYSIFG
jgi:hypothetical protein